MLLAELEAQTLGVERALARIEEAMTLASQLENRCNLSFPYLLRGELLLKCDPPNPAAARKPFELPSTLRGSKARGAGVCAPRWR